MKSNEAHSLRIPEFSSEIAPRRSTALDQWALRRIQTALRSAPLRFVLWDGFELSPPGIPVATIVIKNRPALFAWLWDSELNFGEAYMSGAIEVRGDLLKMFEAVYSGWATPVAKRWWQHRPNSLETAKANVHHHYDLGNEFYRLWLDREMVYTCAYFPTPACSLEEAQVAKMERICEKLRLNPGDRVVEAGCGWGSLALFMARNYGVQVRAFNISTEQIAYARRRADAEGLTRLVEFVEDDYRNVAGTWDVFLSVGMLEHVGLPDYPTLGRVINRTLTDSGRALLHFIGRNKAAPLNAWVQKRIFPGAYPPTLREVFEHVLEPHAFSVLDVENIRLHYAKTLEHWSERFEGASETITQMFDDTFVRAWRLYLTGSQAAFLSGSTQLFQVVFARGSTNDVPWVRTD